MKKIFIYVAMAAMFTMASCSSDYMDVTPVGAVDESALADQNGVEKVVTGMYAALYANNFDDYFAGTLSNWCYGDVMGGSANKGSTFNDQSSFTSLETYSITSGNSYLNIKWQFVYNGVFRSNVVIHNATGIKDKLSALSGESKDYYTETIAQARFIRAFWHFEGMKLFGAAIPYVGTEEYESSVNPQVSNVDASGNYIYIWDKVIDDLKFAYENLPETWSKSGNYGRVNKWAAAALLAKVMMYESSPYNGTNGTTNRWAEVKSLLETIMANGCDSKGTKYKLADTYEELYTAGKSDWTGESVLDIQMAISGTETATNTIDGGSQIGMVGALGIGGWGFYQPSYEMANSYIVDDNGLPLLDKSYQNKPTLTTIDANSVPSTDLTVYTDPRIDFSMGRFDVPYLDYSVPKSLNGWIRDISNGGPYLNKKNIPKNADRGSLALTTNSCSSAKNFHLIRYADVLLWYAEALIETGDPAGARQYVNMVRARAANSYTKAVAEQFDAKASAGSEMTESDSPYVLDDKVNGKTMKNAAANYRIGLYPALQFATKEGATAALRFERKIELGLEGHRWYDLARWGVIENELTNYINYEKKYLTKYSSSVYNSNWVTMPIPDNQITTMQGLLVQGANWK